MEREHLHDDLVELGAASEATRGSAVGREDSDIGQQFLGGIADD